MESSRNKAYSPFFSRSLFQQDGIVNDCSPTLQEGIATRRGNQADIAWKRSNTTRSTTL